MSISYFFFARTAGWNLDAPLPHKPSG